MPRCTRPSRRGATRSCRSAERGPFRRAMSSSGWRFEPVPCRSTPVLCRSCVGPRQSTPDLCQPCAGPVPVHASPAPPKPSCTRPQDRQSRGPKTVRPAAPRPSCPRRRASKFDAQPKMRASVAMPASLDSRLRGNDGFQAGGITLYVAARKCPPRRNDTFPSRFVTTGKFFAFPNSFILQG